MSVDPKGLEAARQAIRYLSSPSTPWSDEQVASVIEAYFAAAIPAQERPCTCHLEDNPPQPCARKYALTDCRRAATSPAGDLVPVAWRADHMVEGEYTRKFTAIRRVAEIWTEQGLSVTPLYAQALRYQSTGVTGDIDDLAAVLWRADATDAGVPQSAVDRRTREAFDDQGDDTKARWRKFARAALSAQERG